MDVPEQNVLEKPEINSRGLLSKVDIINNDGKKGGKKTISERTKLFHDFVPDYPAPHSQIVLFPDLEQIAMRAEVWDDGVLTATEQSMGGQGVKSMEKLETNTVRPALANAGNICQPDGG